MRRSPSGVVAVFFRRRAVVAVVVAVVVGGGVASFPRDLSAAETTTGWVIGHGSLRNGSPLSSGSGYQLFNVYNKTWLDIRHGLDGAKTAQDNIEIVGRGGILRCGEPFTLRVRGQTLVYDPTTTRVALHSNGEISDEWRFTSCKSGDPVVLDGRPTAIVNMRRRDAWVGCKRVSGPPYCWDDRQLMGSATD
jgi:hypothetical protein